MILSITKLFDLVQNNPIPWNSKHIKEEQSAVIIRNGRAPLSDSFALIKTGQIVYGRSQIE